MKEIRKAAGNQHYQGAAAADDGAADGKKTCGVHDIFDRLMVFFRNNWSQSAHDGQGIFQVEGHQGEYGAAKSVNAVLCYGPVQNGLGNGKEGRVM